MKKVILLATFSLLLGACSYGTTSTPKTSNESPMATSTEAIPSKKEIVLTEENKSGQMGTALLEDMDGKVRVTLSMTGTKMETQPAHIHIGVCPGVGAVKYPLTSLVDGKSVTNLEVSMADLLNQGPLAINVHKSAKEVSVYTACGVL